jgi:cyclophilin family peptidyl-prolyl cis-trans isomerase
MLEYLSFILGLTLMSFFSLNAEGVNMENKNPQVIIKVKKGEAVKDIKVELFEDKAPVTVKNFLQYVDEGFYSGTIFHRVINGFMIQGGGFNKDFVQKTTRAPIKNEATNGVKNLKGTLAMARTSDVNSATAQFFINVADNSFLDNRGTTPSEFGYAVFGKVTEGLDVVDEIKTVKTGFKGPHGDVPNENIEILEIKRVK